MDPERNQEIEKACEAAISESYSYLKQKEYDKAYSMLNKAAEIITHYTGMGTETFDPGLYFGSLRRIRERQAEVCIRESKPHYDFYVIQSFEAFALDIACDLRMFPHLSAFYYRKEINWTIHPDDFDDDMELAFKELKIFDYRKEICDEFTNFLYNDLPGIYGIPSKYDKESVNEIFKFDLEKMDELNELLAFEKKFNSKHPTYMTFAINDFVTKLFRKYFERANHDKPDN